MNGAKVRKPHQRSFLMSNQLRLQNTHFITTLGWQKSSSQYIGTVIGAGLSRTGTFSTRIALTKIYNARCFHGFTGSMHPDLADFWLRASYGKVTDEEWKEYLLGQGFASGVGEPISLFFEDLMRVFPKAKVLLTTRPADAWYHSMKKAIIEPRGYLEKPPISWIFDYWGYVEAKEIMEEVRDKATTRLHQNHTSWTAVEAGKEEAVKFFEGWTKMVIDKVPKERLLVYDVREGWEPLCNFLGVPVPDEPFPRINDSATIEWIYKGGYYLLVLGIPLLICSCAILRSKRVREWTQRAVGKITYPVVFCFTKLCRKANGYSLVKQN